LRRWRRGGSERAAFQCVQGARPAASRREIAIVADALRESGDEEVLALFRPPGGEYFDHEACAAVTEIAEQAGAGGVVGLDLYTEVIRPAWLPFPVPGARERSLETRKVRPRR
jgi:hypothetical protein